MDSTQIRLWQTCYACPEQYNAYVGELDLYDPYPQLDMYTMEPRNIPIGFLYLRHGFFFVDVYDGDETVRVYEFSSLDSDGIFEPDEREIHLAAAKQAIANYFTDHTE
jgi:hypothetical protein